MNDLLEALPWISPEALRERMVGPTALKWASEQRALEREAFAHCAQTPADREAYEYQLQQIDDQMKGLEQTASGAIVACAGRGELIAAGRQSADANLEILRPRLWDVVERFDVVGRTAVFGGVQFYGLRFFIRETLAANQQSLIRQHLAEVPQPVDSGDSIGSTRRQSEGPATSAGEPLAEGHRLVDGDDSTGTTASSSSRGPIGKKTKEQAVRDWLRETYPPDGTIPPGVQDLHIVRSFKEATGISVAVRTVRRARKGR